MIEWVEGRDLYDYYRQERVWERPYCLALASQIAVALTRAVGELHQYGLVHRDLKPENFVLAERTEENLLERFLELI